MTSVLRALPIIIMPPVTRNGAQRGRRGRGGRGGNANVQPLAEPAPIGAAIAPMEVAPAPIDAAPTAVVQPIVQAMVVPPPAVPVIAPPNVDQVGV